MWEVGSRIEVMWSEMPEDIRISMKFGRRREGLKPSTDEIWNSAQRKQRNKVK
jgi:hypothetical protein